jgi:hypothetical protein
MIRPSSRLKTVGKRLLREAKVLAPLLVLIVFCFVPKLGRSKERKDAFRYEYFPFSHFPMYSGFGERDYYVFVTDRDGKPIATEPMTFVRSTKLKKVFNTDLSVIQKQFKTRKDLLTAEQCRPAGNATLKQLVELAPEEAVPKLRQMSPLSLHRVYLSLEDGAIVETEPQEVGTWPAP